MKESHENLIKNIADVAGGDFVSKQEVKRILDKVYELGFEAGKAAMAEELDLEIKDMMTRMEDNE